MNVVSPFVCPVCGSILAPDDAFCSHCGAKVDLSPKTIGIGRQIYIYAISLLLPPFGLAWTWKYVRHGSPQEKRVGWIAALLTVIGIVVSVYVTVGFLNGISSQINSVSNYPAGLGL